MTTASARCENDSAPQRYVRNGEVEIAVYETGNRAGATVILVHGWPDTHHLWDEVAPLLADRFHVVSYDTRGHGRTSKPKGRRAFTLDKLVADFHAVADAVCPGRRVHVLAHDWGSVQLWEAVCEPGAEQRIASFTSVSGPNLDYLARWFRDGLTRPGARSVRAPLGQLVASGYTFFFQIPVLPDLAFRLFATPERWKRFIEARDGTPPERIHLASSMRRDMVHGLQIYRANILLRLRHPRERRTRVPVQLLVGLRDFAVRPAGYADYDRWTDTLWRREIDAGHWSPFSHAQVIADATAEMIAAVDGAGPAVDK